MGENIGMKIDKDNENWNKVVKVISSEDDVFEMGHYYTNAIKTDIKHLGFTISRYKFASKLLMYSEKVKVLELGCQEGLGGLMFLQNCNLDRYIGIDLDAKSIAWSKQNLPRKLEFIEANFFDCKEIAKEQFNFVVSLDVIEHIQPIMEDRYCKVIVDHLTKDGIAVIGTPNIRMSEYACEASRVGHVNLYDQERLYKLMNQYFHNVMIFNMNDEVVNTGFAPMACYIFAVCCNKK